MKYLHPDTHPRGGRNTIKSILRRYLRLLSTALVLVALGLLAAACNGEPAPAAPQAEAAPVATPVPPTPVPPTPIPPTPTPDPTPVPPPPEPPATPTPSGPRGLALVEKATVQIVAQGTFADPSGQAVTMAGAGSGFIISADGFVVTNNHVVTGAATLNVFVPGRDEPLNARVIAASECADLAVIQLPGEGYPFLTFHEGPLSIGTPVFAAGYPLGEPEYALVAGIISKLDADGESNWASVDQVIQHDAAVSPGNSGGPLVTEAGDVVGIVYAGLLEFNQFFAVGLAQALPVLDELMAGNNVDWIGINGEAFVGQGFSGLWVASVESGSPADAAGILPGDFIYELERLPLGGDGTMRDYCDVLQTKGADRAMQVALVRFDTGEILEGQINGRPLAVTGSLDGALEPEQPVDPEDPPPPDQELIGVTDDTGRISVTVPADWELGTAPYGDTPAIDAAPDLAAWNDSFLQIPVLASAPGIFLGMMDSEDGSAVTDAELQEFMDFNPVQENCFFDSRDLYSDALYTGYVDVFSCTNGATRALLAATEDSNPVYIAVIESVAFTATDRDAVQGVYASFVMYTEAELDGEDDIVEYAQASDDTGQIVANVRTNWDTNGAAIEGVPVLHAAPDIGAWMERVFAPDPIADTTGIMLLVLFGEPGEMFGDADLDELLSTAPLPVGCAQSGRFHYADPIYGGMVLEAECGGETRYTILAVVQLDSPTYIVAVQSVTKSAADRTDVQEFYDTFIVYPDEGLGGDPVEPPEGSGEPDVPGGVVGVWDDTLTLFAELPQPWETTTNPVEGVPIINAAPNLENWFDSVAGNPGRHSPPYPGIGINDGFETDVAGIFVTVIETGLDEVDAQYLSEFIEVQPIPVNCTYEGRRFFEGDLLSGQFDESTCAQSGTHRVYALLHLDYPSIVIWIEVVTVSNDDELALIHFLSTLVVDPIVPL